MLLEPSGNNRWRLVLDFAAPGGTTARAATAPAAATQARAAATPAVVRNPATAAGRKPIVLIDPGHGGRDPGAIGVTGTREKDIVLTVSRRLRDRLNQAGYTVHMTRNTDVFLNLNTRAAMATQHRADIFISVHANANPRATVRGFSVYTLSQQASDADAARLAEAENAADKIDVDNFAGFELATRHVLSALQQRAVDEDSVQLARRIRREMRRAEIDRVDRPHRFAPFAVLRNSTPSCLVELGHLSNRDEERLLRSEAHQNRLVAAMVTAIGNFDFNA
jgi:N-acetylmuramoyl-L-alanine amidase